MSAVVATAALFDMDGTLVDSTAVVEAIWTEFAATYTVNLAELLAYAHGRQTLDTVTRFLGGGAEAEVVAADLEAAELLRTDGIVAVAGAERVMAELSGFPVAVVTSAPRQLAKVRMRAAGLPVPQVLVAAEDVSVGKPAPDGYLTAASALGQRIDECVVFEDADAGLLAGVASGATTVVVGGYAGPSADGLPRIRTFDDLRVELNGQWCTFTLRPSAVGRSREADPGTGQPPR